MSQIRFYFDEDAMPRKVVAGLRARGVDVLTAGEAGMISRDDEEHLQVATSQGRVVYSFNDRDFYRIHAEWIAAQSEIIPALCLPSSSVTQSANKSVGFRD